MSRWNVGDIPSRTADEDVDPDVVIAEAEERRVKKMRSKRYPGWICSDCGKKHGLRKAILATFHEPDLQDESDRCGWCGSSTKLLTEPRDYGYPRVLT